MQNLVNTHAQASPLFPKGHVAAAQKDAALGDGGEPLDFAALLAQGVLTQPEDADLTKAGFGAAVDAKLERALNAAADIDGTGLAATPPGGLADLAQTVLHLIPAHALANKAAPTTEPQGTAADTAGMAEIQLGRARIDVRAAAASVSRNGPAAPLAARDDLSARPVVTAAPTIAADNAKPARDANIPFEAALLNAATEVPLAAASPESASAAPLLAAQSHGMQVRDIASAGAQAPIQTPVGAPHWDTELSQRVIWTANQNSQSAEIHITPPDLGPIAMTLNLDAQQSGQQATIHFVSAHAPVREALEAALPRLREMMAEAGISLGNATVSSESFQQSTQQEARSGHRHAQGESRSFSVDLPSARDTRSGLGLVDLFA